MDFYVQIVFIALNNVQFTVQEFYVQNKLNKVYTQTQTVHCKNQTQM